MKSVTEADIDTLIVALKEGVLSSLRLTMKLADDSLALRNGWSHKGMDFIEKIMVRLIRCISLQKFRSALIKIKECTLAFYATTNQADVLLKKYAQPIPCFQKSIRDARADIIDTSSTNTDWANQMMDAMEALMDYLDDMDRVRWEYINALLHIKEQIGAVNMEPE